MTPLATTTLVIAANAPDIDVLSYVRGEYFALAFRRGITHGWPALLLLPFVVTAGVLLWDRRVRLQRNPNAEPARPLPVLVLAALGLLTHPTLDWMNTYGMRWGLPFDGSWSYGDTLFIIDPWIWLGLGGAVFLLTASSRRGSLAAVVVYIAAMATADAVATRHVSDAATAAGLTVEDVMVAPLPANPFRSDVTIVTPDGYVPGTHRWIGAPRVSINVERTAPLLASPPGHSPDRVEEIVAAARSEPDVRSYLVWSRYPYVRVTPNETGWAVRFGDARYGDATPGGGLAGITVDVTEETIR